MRLVKVSMPIDMAEAVKLVAFDCGIESVSVHASEKFSSDGSSEPKSVVEVETSTPKAKRFVETLLVLDFFDREKYSIVVRQPRALYTSEDIRNITLPLEEPGIDLYEELWQFSHITYGLVGRVLIASGLLAYGLIGQKILLIVAGLLFLPLLPMLLAIGFGAIARQWKLVLQGFTAFIVSVALLVLGGAVTALFAYPPMKYSDFSSFFASLLISTIVGVAAGLASIDDAGRRELIGLAAAAQIGIIPAWIGVCIIFGPPPTSDWNDVSLHFVSLITNAAMIIAASAAVHVATGVTNNISRVKNT